MNCTTSSSCGLLSAPLPQASLRCGHAPRRPQHDSCMTSACVRRAPQAQNVRDMLSRLLHARSHAYQGGGLQYAVHDALTCVRVVCSQLNFDNFAVVANTALGINLSPSFDVFTNDFTFLLGCYTFEDVGVTAYHVRAATPLQNAAQGCCPHS